MVLVCLGSVFVVCCGVRWCFWVGDWGYKCFECGCCLVDLGYFYLVFCGLTVGGLG